MPKYIETVHTQHGEYTIEERTDPHSRDGFDIPCRMVWPVKRMVPDANGRNAQKDTRAVTVGICSTFIRERPSDAIKQAREAAQKLADDIDRSREANLELAKASKRRNNSRALQQALAHIVLNAKAKNWLIQNAPATLDHALAALNDSGFELSDLIDPIPEEEMPASV